MRIAFLNITAALGGAERLLLDLLFSLGHITPAVDCHLIVAEDGPLVELARELGVTVQILSMPSTITQLGDSALHGRGRLLRSFGLLSAGIAAIPGILSYSRQLHTALCDISPDIVHSNSLKFHLLAHIAGVRGWRVVWHLHDYVGSRPVIRRLLRWASRSVSGAVAVSTSVAIDAASLLSIPLKVLPNGIDLERFVPGPAADLDSLAGLPPANVLRVGLVATYATWKGHDVFLSSARRVAATLPVRFYVIGGPIYRTGGSQWTLEQLRQLADELIAQQRVGFIGFQVDTVPIYRALDIVVHASTRPEPFGLTIAEAMSCGRAVVVSNAGGASELFTHGHDALGVAPENVSELTNVLTTLLTDADQRARLGIMARRSAIANFSRDRLGPQLLAAYDQFSFRR